MTETAEPIRDWQLERYLLDELPAAERRQVDEALAREPELRRRLDDLERSGVQVLEEVPPATMAAAVRTTMARDRVVPRRSLTPLAAAAMVAASLAGLAFWAPWRGEPQGEDVTRVKGIAPYLLLYRKAESDVERLAPAAVARHHDVLQLAYQAGARRYGVIVSVDGRGVLTRHLPVIGAQAAPLAAGSPVPLPQSYELDDAPGFERFVLVAADEPFPVEQVESEVRRQHREWGAAANERRLELPDAMDQFSLVVRKESSR
jgi:hypothetical protein